jgi:hypothetical protein
MRRLLIVIAFALLCGSRSALAQEPLHVRVDAIIDVAAVGPMAAPASDADFVRRVYLDLTGMIPTATQTRAFLADQTPDKRTKVIDQLIASPQFDRYMALLLDVMLMERRGDKAVPTPVFQEYLRKSIADNKPLDQLFKELISTDGADPNLRPAAKFFLDRDCEPNTMTRDLGKIVFGLDLQCAQCHDHPNISDYYQADYYGLFSFAMRTTVFNDAKAKTLYAMEKADGDAAFKSVFTNVAVDKQQPKLPKGAVAFEPLWAKGDEYTVAPGKEIRHIPKHSRRAQLGAMLADNDTFRRNVANRIWLLLFGRGLVHPAEWHHADNPPSHPELLTLLADELKKANFQLKPLIRELALTKAYQRSCDVPVGSIGFPPVRHDLPPNPVPQLEAQRAPLTARIEELKALLTAATAKVAAAREPITKQQADLVPLQTNASSAKAAADKAQADKVAAEAALATKRDQAKAVTDAVTATAAALAKLPGDAALTQVSTQLGERKKGIDGEVTAAETAMAPLVAAAEQAAAPFKAALDAFNAAQQALPIPTLQQAEQEEISLRRQLQDAQFALKRLEWRIALANDIAKYQQLAASDANAAAALLPSITERLELSLQVSRLRGLTAEQFALSLMQANGVVEAQYPGVLAKLEKEPPDALKMAAEADRPRIHAQLAEGFVFENLRGVVNTFVAHYGSLVGGDVQSSVNQSLFFANGALVEGYVTSESARLAQIADVSALADEMYVKILSRPPTDADKAAVAAHLQGRDADRAVAIKEMTWGLLSGVEFRFNH